MKKIFSGIQPSGVIHIGNYLGAIKHWVLMQDGNETIFCIVDLHAITVAQKPEELNKRIIEITKHYLLDTLKTRKINKFNKIHKTHKINKSNKIHKFNKINKIRNIIQQ